MKHFLAGMVMVSLLAMPLSLLTAAPVHADAGNEGELAVSQLAGDNKNLIDNVRIFYNASLIHTAQPVLLESGRCSLAFLDFFEGIGVPVEWDGTSRCATVTTESQLIVIYPDSGQITINGQPMVLEAKPQMVGYHIYVPLRFLSEQLGYAVSYAVEEETHVIRITGTAPEMLKINDGAVTRIKNRTNLPAEPENAQNHSNYAQWKENHVRCFIDGQGLLHQLVSTGNTDKLLEIRHIDPTKAAVEQSTYTLPETMMALGKITAAGKNSYELILNPASSTRYVGIGEPVNTTAAAVFDTSLGRLLLYNSQSTTKLLSIDAQSGQVKGVYDEPERGYVLDTLELNHAVANASYAISADGRYAFLLDGYLLIVDPDNLEVIHSEMLSTELEDGQIAAYGHRFIITGTENSRFTGHMGYYTTTYSSDGQCQRFYTNQTAKKAQTEWGYLQVLDQYTKGNMIYTLLKTNWDHYLSVYDAEEDIFTIKELPYKYTSFVPSADGEQLFLQDTAYFYLQPVK